MNLNVIKALLIKHAIIRARNTFRLLDIFFWPVIDLLVWGYLTMYMLKLGHTVPTLITFLIGAIILWNIFYRAQQVVCVTFLDDLWSRNLLNVFAAPLSASEYICAACLVGILEAAIVTALMGTMACLIYSFQFFSLGFGIAFLFANLLLMGWAMGIFIIGFILRYGPPAEGLAWAMPFLLQPISAVFYPVSVLPQWLQYVSWCVPSTYAFEGMRHIVETGQMNWHYVQIAFVLNLIYMAVSACIFQSLFEASRAKGLLAKYGT